jgi:hypothetical protein
MDRPPDETCRPRRNSILDPHKSKIDALLAKYPELSAVRVLEEIRKEPDGYRGQISVVREYLREVRPDRRRVYLEVHYEPGQAMQVDWGECGSVQVGATSRMLSRSCSLSGSTVILALLRFATNLAAIGDLSARISS